MIQRLVTTLRSIATLPEAGLPAADIQRLFGDCADAVRLELDCPQQTLTPPQRLALAQLSDLLDSAAPDPADVAPAAQRVRETLGLATLPLSDGTID